MEQLKSGLSGHMYRVGSALPGLGEGFYRGFVESQDVTLRITGTSPQEVTQLRAEAALLESLNHPQITKLHDRGRTSQHFFLVLDGPAERPLVELIHQQDLSVTMALEVAWQVLVILETLHSAGVVWGWLRPQAFWMEDAGKLKLIDLRSAGEGTFYRPLSLAEATYLAPELGSGQPATSSGDLYEWGVLTYELLAGRPPFSGSDPTELAVKHLAEPVPDLGRLRPDLPPEIVALVSQCLVKAPDRRPDNVAAVRSELEPIRERLLAEERARLVTCPRCQAQILPTERCPMCNAQLTTPTTPTRQRRRKLVPLVAIGVSTLLFLCVLVVLFGETEDDTSAAAMNNSATATSTIEASAVPTEMPTILPTATAVPTPQGMVKVTPDNVADPNIDLIRVRAYAEGEDLLTDIEVAGKIGESSSQTTYQVFFDVDGSDTGDTSSPWSTLGADYTILYRSNDESGMAFRWENEAWQGVGAATIDINGGRLTLRIPAEWFDDTETLRYGVLTTNPRSNLADYAPARGEDVGMVTSD